MARCPRRQAPQNQGKAVKAEWWSQAGGRHLQILFLLWSHTALLLLWRSVLTLADFEAVLHNSRFNLLHKLSPRLSSGTSNIALGTNYQILCLVTPVGRLWDSPRCVVFWAAICSSMAETMYLGVASSLEHWRSDAKHGTRLILSHFSFCKRGKWRAGCLKRLLKTMPVKTQSWDADKPASPGMDLSPFLER